MTQQPVREALPDRLRGIALLGIVVVNAAFLGISADGFTAESVDGPANRITALLVIALQDIASVVALPVIFSQSHPPPIIHHHRHHRHQRHYQSSL